MSQAAAPSPSLMDGSRTRSACWRTSRKRSSTATSHSVRAISALFAEGDFPAAIAHFDRAFDLGRRFGDRDAQMLALVGKGRALVKSGEIDAGLELLDEATAAAVSGGSSRTPRRSSTA